jgi:hypothetical protein
MGTMKVAIRFSAREEAKALPILLRHSAGMILPNRTYVITVEAMRALRKAGIEFTQLGNEADAPGGSKGSLSRERVCYFHPALLQ